MPATQEQIPIAYVSPTGWKKLKTGSYADPNMLLGADGEPLTNIKFYQAHLAVQMLGIRLVDDRDFNDLVNTDAEVVEQMRKYAVWTSMLKNVESAKNGGYTAKHIARPEVSSKGGVCTVGGREKRIKLPEDGFFKINELLESETGLPEKTYGENVLDESCAYWAANEGPERSVLRGGWCWSGHRGFDADARWGPSGSYTGVGARGASEEEPKPIVFASAESIRKIEETSRKYGVEPAEVVAVLGSRFSNK